MLYIYGEYLIAKGKQQQQYDIKTGYESASFQAIERVLFEKYQC